MTARRVALLLGGLAALALATSLIVSLIRRDGNAGNLTGFAAAVLVPIWVPLYWKRSDVPPQWHVAATFGVWLGIATIAAACIASVPAPPLGARIAAIVLIPGTAGAVWWFSPAPNPDDHVAPVRWIVPLVLLLGLLIAIGAWLPGARVFIDYGPEFEIVNAGGGWTCGFALLAIAPGPAVYRYPSHGRGLIWALWMLIPGIGAFGAGPFGVAETF